MANEIQFPTSPTNGNIYSMGGRNYRYDSAQDKFVAVATATIVEGGGVTIYATIDDLPLSGNTQGDLAHVTANNTLYFWNGSGWYKIALINNSPSISNVNSSYTLSDVGADTVITIVAEDPEGLAITYSIASDTSGNTATVVQGTGANTNIFTITPSTDANDNGTFSLTFRASDGVNIATAPASFTLNILTTIPNSNYTTALITSVGGNNAVNNSFVDSSTNSHTITAAGNATQTTFSPYRHGGYSYYWDGSGTDYFQILSPTAALDFGTGDFTIEMWIWLNDLSSGIILADTRPSETNGNQYIGAFSIGTDGNYQMHTNNVQRIVTTGAPITAGSWHHIALQRNSGTLEAYVDGSRNATASFTQSLDASRWSLFKNSFASGGVADAGGGYIKDYRVVKGTAVYSGTSYNVPTESLTNIAGTSFLLFSSNYLKHEPVGTESITWTNGMYEPFAPYDYSTYASGDHGGSMYFDGSGDYLSAAADTSFSYGTGDFTIEAWVYPAAFGTSGTYRLICGAGGSGQGDQLLLNNNNTGQILYFLGGSSVTTTNEVTKNAWNHVAVSRSSGTIKIFINGVEGASASDSTNITSGATNTLYVGNRSGGADSPQQSFIGYIGDLRIVKGSAVYTSAFTPPTAPLTAITNTSLLLSGTNAGIIDKSQSAQKLTLNGDVKSSTTQTKYLSSSMYFDGTGDYVSVDSDDSLNFGTGDFTIEAWINTTTKVNFQTIVGKWDNTNGYWLHVEATGYVIGGLSGSSYLQGSVDVADGNWHHIAMTRSGTTVRIFVDGTLDSSATQNNTATNTSELRIGSLNSTYARYFVGYISDVRITKDLARYTANFTPPTEALLG